MLDKQGYMHMPTRPGTHIRERTHSHTDRYAILIAFLLQQWLRKRALMLRYTYIACLVFSDLYLVLKEKNDTKHVYNYRHTSQN
jgi:hypothetical protein